jgi:putative transposase
MKSDSKDHHRRSIRLKDYDYAQPGGYFVTIVTQSRKCLFGEIVEAEMRLNDAGRIIQTAWDDLPNHYANVEIDTFVVMPNHIHGIVVLVGAGPRARPGADGQPQGVAPTIKTSLSLPDVVHRFKTLTTKQYIDGVKQYGWRHFAGRLWRRNYFEHVIRDDSSLNRIRQYILDNPARWEFDRENPDATKPEPEYQWRMETVMGASLRSGQPRGVAPTKNHPS